MSKAAETKPPPPDINELIQKDVARIKRLLGLDVNRLALGSEVEGIVVEGPFGSTDYTIKGVNLIEFVNVSTSLGPAQGSSGPPAQVTGLTVTPQSGSDTQLNLSWTAITAPDFNYYSVYRGPTGFTPGPAFIIASPVATNSYANTGLTAGTTYYYRVSTTNDAELEGSASSQVSGTTTGTAPISPTLSLSFDNNYTDSTGLNSTFNRIAAGNTTFATAGVFGSHYAQLNIPGIPNTLTPDHIGALDNTNCQLDFTNGFSYSFWIKPSDISATSGTNYDRIILLKVATGAGRVWIGIDPSGRLFADVFRNSTAVDYHKRDTVVLSTSAFTHVAVTFNPTTNTLLLYKNKVSQTTTGALSSLMNSSGQYVNLTLGHDANSADFTPYEGAIDELKYYKTVLTQTQINNLFATNNT